MTDYTLAQALWLAREYPNADIHPLAVTQIEFRYEHERQWSSLTFQDSDFTIIVTHATERKAWIYLEGDTTIDLTRMVTEGLQLLKEQQ